MSLRNAISQGLSQLDVQTKDAAQLQHAVNKEIRPVLREARKSLNALNAEPISPSVTTDGAGTYAVLWTSGEMPQDAIWEIRAHVSGNSASSGASYSLLGVFQSVSGVCSQVFPDAFEHSYESAAACDVRLSIDPTNRIITVDARDDGATAMSWTGMVYTPAEAVIE